MSHKSIKKNNEQLDTSYQDLLNNSSVLLTDYSSVFFDFAYLKKPVIYYHPENDSYHYEGSYFDYETMGFGDVAIDKELPANSTVIFDLELIDVQKVR